MKSTRAVSVLNASGDFQLGAEVRQAIDLAALNEKRLHQATHPPVRHRRKNSQIPAHNKLQYLPGTYQVVN